MEVHRDIVRNPKKHFGLSTISGKPHKYGDSKFVFRGFFLKISGFYRF